MPGDDELLDLLAQALAPAPAEPSLAELTALQDAVRYPLSAGWRSRWGRRFDRRAIAALVGAGFLATSGTAFAVEREVPPPVRTVAHAVGLPVDSPQEHDARSAAGRLRHALGQPNDDFVRQAATNLRSRLDDLPTSDRRQVGGDDLLRDADQRLTAQGNGRHAGDGHATDGAAGDTNRASSNSGDGHKDGGDDRSGTDTRHTTSTTSSFRAPSNTSGGSGSGSGSGSDDGGTRSTSTTSSTSTTIRSGDGSGSGSGGDSGGTSGSSGSSGSGSTGSGTSGSSNSSGG